MRKAKMLWNMLGDIPTNNECIELPFMHFSAGTHREEIWHWFESAFDVRVYDLMNGTNTEAN
jgi:hypothetical protein